MREWISTEWWRTGPAALAAGLTATLVARESVSLPLDAFEGVTLQDAQVAGQQVRMAASQIAWSQVVSAPSATTLLSGGVLLSASLAWRSLSTRQIGHGWWAHLARSRQRTLIESRMRTRFRYACRKLDLGVEMLSMDVDELGNVRILVRTAGRTADQKAAEVRSKLERELRNVAGMMLIDPLGWPEDQRVEDADGDRAAHCIVRMRFRNLPPPHLLPPDLAPAPVNEAGHDCIRLGLSSEGWVVWDLEEHPHLNVTGVTGGGKGIMLSRITNQAVRRGWLVMIIDGGSSPEHENLWGPLIGSAVNYVPPVDDEVENLKAWVRQLRDVISYAGVIRRLCKEHKVGSWGQLPPELKRRHPRLLLPIDEMTMALRKTGEKGPDGRGPSEAEILRKIVADRIMLVRRGYRKFGVHSILFDQISYAGQTHVGSDVLQQASFFVHLGAAKPKAREMVSGTTDWPVYTAGRLRGVAGAINAPETIREIVQPFVTDKHLKPVVAAEARAWAARISS